MDPDQITAAVASLAKDGIDPDIQELLVHGNLARSVPPGALARAIVAATASGQRKINWGSDPDAIVEDDEPQIGRDYA